MAFTLAPEAIAAGYRLSSFTTIGSTNTEAMALARAGDAGPLWVQSNQQTAGRGRRGNAWMSPPGNLAASLLTTTDLPPARVATLGFVAGVALIEALEDGAQVAGVSPSPLAEEVSRCRMRRASSTDPSSVTATPRHLLPQGKKRTQRFSLKWPNDLLGDGAKLAGIGLETEEGSRGRAVVIGIGVNVAHAPEGLPYAVTSLAALGLRLTAEQLFTALSAQWVRAFALWDEGRGFAAVRASWLARAAGLGRPIVVRQSGSERRGIFETIDQHGQLVLRGEGGAADLVSAGDVHFGGAATLRPGAAA